MKRYIKSSISDEIASEPMGIPLSMPTKADLIKMIYQLHGRDLTDAIARLDSSGNWYRDDRRQKRQYLINVVDGNFYDDPAESSDVGDAIETNYELIYVVTGVSPYNRKEFKEKFGGHYDSEQLYKRAGR